MIRNLSFIWQCGVLTALLLLAALLVLPRTELAISMDQFMGLLLAVSLINIITWLILNRGIGKDTLDGTLISMGGIGLKFLLYLLCILGFWLPSKNLSKAFIIVFFALYLIFTFLLAFNLFKMLRNK